MRYLANYILIILLNSTENLYIWPLRKDSTSNIHIEKILKFCILNVHCQEVSKNECWNIKSNSIHIEWNWWSVEIHILSIQFQRQKFFLNLEMLVQIGLWKNRWIKNLNLHPVISYFKFRLKFDSFWHRHSTIKMIPYINWQKFKRLL